MKGHQAKKLSILNFPRLTVLATISASLFLIFSGCKMRQDSDLQNIHGKPVAAENFPWLASIKDSDGIHECNGTFVSKKSLITAGHCPSGIVRGVTPRFSLYLSPIDAKLLVFDREMENNFKSVDFDYQPKQGDQLQITTFDAYTRGEFENLDLFDGENWIDSVNEVPLGTEIQVSYSDDPNDGVGLDVTNSGTAAFYQGKIIGILSNKSGNRLNFTFLGHQGASVKMILESLLPKLENSQSSITSVDFKKITDYLFESKLEHFILSQLKERVFCDSQCDLYLIENFMFRDLRTKILDKGKIGNSKIFGPAQHIESFGKDRVYENLIFLDESSSENELLSAIKGSAYHGVIVFEVDKSLLERAKANHIIYDQFIQDSNLVSFKIYKAN